jgi:putative peptidoglycan lipid II flippase
MGDDQKIKEYLSHGLGIIIIFILPVTVGLIVLAKPIVSLLFARGSFNEQDIRLTSECLIFYSVGLIGYNINPLLSKAFYALEDTKTPTVNSAIAVGCNVLLNIILISGMQHRGLALASSIASIITTVLLLMSLKKKLGALNLRSLLFSGIKMFMASLIMGGAVFTANRALASLFGSSFRSAAVNVTVSVLLGLLIYAFLVLILRVPQATEILNIVKARLSVVFFARRARVKS